MADAKIIPANGTAQVKQSKKRQFSSATRSGWVRASKKKDDLLGLPFGTAMARLRKKIMYDLAGRLGLCACHHCGGDISLDQFSIEHMNPWQQSSDPSAAFFDIENISFSHHRCNVRAATRWNKKYADARERSRVQFAAYYARNGRAWNDRRNTRRRKNERKAIDAP